MEKQSPLYGALPYLKSALAEESEQGGIEALSEDDQIVEIRFNETLTIAFLYDDREMDVLRYVQQGDLQTLGVTPDALLRLAVDNLYERTDTHELQLQSFDDARYEMLLMDGHFEASLLLLDDLWEATLKGQVESGFVAAIPSSDVLMFCDRQDEQGIAEMKAVVDQIEEVGGQVLCRQLLSRIGDKWVSI
ncbi:uncharacterized protein YtpQ (UPF0354 family) [Paenibacillus phyllosphaerae]|uniref:Uncharacterized protein YtpQ (UPF0354 family) n=1 Tax=Paenibacillus phyllosphaerae TaxID=274593 RepID=A0A7W5B028_9BACL|nr:hypothetical protein [Paenibacillus phyllosphaerae]MBB3111937.1 uncharacterized protein YtpQ (UPF0354 family) [Paenibacillus phyllosphaerae]